MDAPHKFAKDEPASSLGDRAALLSKLFHELVHTHHLKPELTSESLQENEEMYQELLTYQFPHVQNKDELVEEPYQAYTNMYIQNSRGYVFFRGYLNPSIVERAKIYRALEFSHEFYQKSNDDSSLDESMHPYIVFLSSNGLVIKRRPGYNIPRYDFFLSHSDQYIFVPPGFNQVKAHEFAYFRRLLTNFDLTEHIGGRLIVNQEQDNYFLMLALDQPLRDELTRKWVEYQQGGVLRSFDFKSEKLDQVLAHFEWKLRERFEITPDDKIRIWVRSPSLDDFYQKITSIQSGSLSPRFKKD